MLPEPKRKQKKNPHAIQYLDYKKIDGIPIATKWVWEWKEGEGLTNSIGKASLTNIKFVTVDEDTFKQIQALKQNKNSPLLEMLTLSMNTFLCHNYLTNFFFYGTYCHHW
jgi:hypothetical protein